MTRLRFATARQSAFALPPSRFRLRASAFARRATADKSRYGGQVALRRTRRDYGETSPLGPLPPSRFALRGQVAARRDNFTTAVAVMIGGGSTLLACPVCFGAEETSMIDGAKLGVLVMLAVLFVVQGGFVGFFLYLRRRAKRIADIELDMEWSKLQGASRT